MIPLLKEVVVKAIVSAVKKHFGFEPQLEEGRIVVFSDSLRKKPLYCEMSEERVIFANLFPKDFGKLSPPAVEIEEDGWVSGILELKEEMGVSELGEVINSIFAEVKKATVKALDDPEAATKFFSVRMIEVLSRRFLLAGVCEKPAWSPYPVLAKVGDKICIDGVEGDERFPFTMYSDGKLMVRIEKGLVEIDVRSLANRAIEALTNISKLTGADVEDVISRLKERPEEILSSKFVEDAARVLSNPDTLIKAPGDAKKLAEILKLVDLIVMEEKRIESIVIGKELLLSRLGERIISGNRLLAKRLKTRKYRGKRVLSIREEDFGVEFPEGLDVEVIDACGKKYIVIELGGERNS